MHSCELRSFPTYAARFFSKSFSIYELIGERLFILHEMFFHNSFSMFAFTLYLCKTYGVHDATAQIASLPSFLIFTPVFFYSFTYPIFTKEESINETPSHATSERTDYVYEISSSICLIHDELETSIYFFTITL